MDEGEIRRYVTEAIGRRIAGDVAFSEEPGRVLRKWREYFGASQNDIARIMHVAASVVSDYEKGKRQPGSRFIRRYVMALLEVDRMRGWPRVRQLSRTMNLPVDAVIDMNEFVEGVTIADLVEIVEGQVLTPEFQPDRQVYGYTVIDSIRSIASMSGIQFYSLFGHTPDRVVIFTGVKTGRSPMVAVRVSPVKPSVVVIHGPRRNVDPLAIELAKLDGVHLILSLARDVETMVKRLRMYTAGPSSEAPLIL